MYVCVFVCVYTHMHVCVCVHTCVCVYVHMCMMQVFESTNTIHIDRGVYIHVIN